MITQNKNGGSNMRNSIKFIFAFITAIILAIPLFPKNISAAHEESLEQITKNIEHGEKVTENTEKSTIKGHVEEVTAQNVEGMAHEETHGSSQIWPHYGKMIIFAKFLFAFMIFSFIAPLVHFYFKSEPPLKTPLTLDK